MPRYREIEKVEEMDEAMEESHVINMNNNFN